MLLRVLVGVASVAVIVSVAAWFYDRHERQLAFTQLQQETFVADCEAAQAEVNRGGAYLAARQRMDVCEAKGWKPRASPKPLPTPENYISGAELLRQQGIEQTPEDQRR